MIYGTLVFIFCVMEHGNRTPKHPMLLPLLLLVAATISAVSVYAAQLSNSILTLKFVFKRRFPLTPFPH